MAGEAFAALAPLYDQVMSRVPYAAWAEHVEQQCEHWGGAHQRVLDLACGTGSVALELLGRGRQVVGVDRSRPMLVTARQRARQARVQLPLVQQDMARLSLHGGFDLVICLFDSLNYLLEPSELLAAFRGVRRALEPGGLFMFDLNTELAYELELFTQEDLDPAAEVRLRWRSRYDKATRLAQVNMEFFLDDGVVVGETHHQRAYAPEELRAAAAAAELHTLGVYDAYTFNLPRRRSDRVFYVCRRP